MSDFTSILPSSSISGAYRASQGLKGTPLGEAATTEAPSFTQMVSEAAAETLETIRADEKITTAGMRGEFSTQQVVEATMELETTLKMAISMRDKLVEAYQEIMRMPI